MPLYEFVCEECGDDFEELVRSTNGVGEVTCPTCSGERVQKKISTFASKLAGSDAFSSAASSAAACSPGGV